MMKDFQISIVNMISQSTADAGEFCVGVDQHISEAQKCTIANVKEGESLLHQRLAIAQVSSSETADGMDRSLQVNDLACVTLYSIVTFRVFVGNRGISTE